MAALGLPIWQPGVWADDVWEAGIWEAPIAVVDTIGATPGTGSGWENTWLHKVEQFGGQAPMGSGSYGGTTWE